MYQLFQFGTIVLILDLLDPKRVLAFATFLVRILRRNPLGNWVTVPTSGQKSHHPLRVKIRYHEAFWYGFETKAFSSKQTKKWKYRNWRKLYVKATCPIISFGSWTLQKIMKLADVAIKQQPSKFIKSKRWYKEKIFTADDFFCCKGICLKKKMAKGRKGILPWILFLSYFVITLTVTVYCAHSEILKCVTVDNF